MANGTGGLAKATLTVKAGSPSRTELRFYYNPAEYTITGGTTWNRPQNRRSSGRPEFSTTNPRTIQLEIFFDDWEAGKGTVADDVACLFDWTQPTGRSVGQNRPEPPTLAFVWGKNPVIANFKGYLKSVSAKYTLFDDKGKPIRATANITLEEIADRPGRTNPSSGGREGYRSHLLAEGDSLTSVSHAEYGDPTLWRALAVYNGIDDPLRITMGTSLLIPEITEAKRLSDA